MKDEIHRDRFHVPDNLRVIPKGTRRSINGTVYYWNGKKWQLLPEKREKRGPRAEVTRHGVYF